MAECQRHEKSVQFHLFPIFSNESTETEINIVCAISRVFFMLFTLGTSIFSDYDLSLYDWEQLMHHFRCYYLVSPKSLE